MTPFRSRVPWLRMAPPSCGEPFVRPPCSVIFASVSDAPAATSNRRNGRVLEAVLRAMVSPLPWMVRLLPAAMTGSPFRRRP